MMPARRLRVAAPLVALLALGCWLLLRSEDGRGPDRPTGDAAAAIGTADGSAGASAPASERATDPATTNDASSRAAVDAPSGDDDAELRADTLHVRVVQKADGAPVPFATVIAVPPEGTDASPDAHDRPAAAFDDFARVFAVGRRFVADGHGVAVVPRPHRLTRIAALHDGASGLVDAIGPEPAGGFVIELVADRSLVVQATTADGAPAPGLTIGVRGVTGSVPARAGTVADDDERERWMALAITDETGLARIDRLQTVGLDGWRDLAVVAVEPGLCDHGVALDLAQQLPARVELRIQPSGALRFETARGAAPADVGIDWIEIVEKGLVLPSYSRMPRAASTVWRYVGLGRSWQVMCRFGVAGVRREVIGPVQAGQEVVVALAPPVTPRLVVRVVDPNGAPRSVGRLQWMLRVAGEDTAVPAALCDESGRWVADLPREFAGKHVVAAARLLVGGSYVGLRADLQFDAVAGDTDLGELRLERLPEFARGVVVGVDPLPPVRLDVRLSQPLDAPYEEVDAGAELGADGRLTIFSASRAPLVLSVSADGCVPHGPIEVLAGTQDLRIEIVPGGEVGVRARADERLLEHADLVVLDLRPAGGESILQVGGERRGDALAWHLAAVPPGRYDFSWFLFGEPEPFFVVDDVAVPGGRVASDPRLLDIDLRGRVHVVRLDCVDEQGAAIDELAIWRPTRRDRVGMAEQWCPGGVCWLPATVGVDVIVTASGHQPVRYQGGLADARVRLANAIAVEVAVVCAEPPPEGVRRTLWCRRRSEPPTLPVMFGLADAASTDVEVEVEADGSARFAIERPGDFDCEVRLVADGGESRRTAPVLQTTLSFTTAGRHRVEVTSEQMQRALVSLRAPR